MDQTTEQVTAQQQGCNQSNAATVAEGTHSPPSLRSTVKPKGILKNSKATSESTTGNNNVGKQASARAGAGGGLAWDEANLSLNEVQRDATMKITEPKVSDARKCDLRITEFTDTHFWPDFPRRLTSDTMQKQTQSWIWTVSDHRFKRGCHTFVCTAPRLNPSLASYRDSGIRAGQRRRHHVIAIVSNAISTSE